MTPATMWYHKNKDKARITNRRWQQANKERKNRGERIRTRKLRIEMISAYGGKCECCGIFDMEFLTIDHKRGEGNKHRRENNCHGGSRLYTWLKKRGWPKEDFRLLCFNCNCARGFFGFCPHERERAICPQ